jgi:predicted transcriptional regulator
MGCIDPDGTLTLTAKFLIKTLAEGPLPPEDIAKVMSEPIFRVRGNLRELTQANLIQEEGGLYSLTDEGREKL